METTEVLKAAQVQAVGKSAQSTAESWIAFSSERLHDGPAPMRNICKTECASNIRARIIPILL